MAKFPKTLLLVSSVKIQYARDDEGPHSCINQNKNIDNDLYCSSNEFPNHLALLTMLSPSSQNEFINLLAEDVKNRIVKDVVSAEMYSVMTRLQILQIRTVSLWQFVMLMKTTCPTREFWR